MQSRGRRCPRLADVAALLAIGWLSVLASAPVAAREAAGDRPAGDEPSPKSPAPAATQPQQGAGDKKGVGSSDSGKDSSTPQNPGERPKSDGAEAKSSSGFNFSLQEQSEVWANLRRGGRRGASYNGLTTASLDLDLEKTLGWKAARFFVSAYDIHGHGPSRSLVGNNQLVSNIEATPSVKLYDLWVEQQLFDTLSLRAGQEGANDELMTSSYGALFLNASFGFPGLPAADLPSGGPNYPLAAPFIRAQWKVSDKLQLAGAVFNGDPAPRGAGDPQIRDRNGTAFRVDGHTLSFAEIRYSPDPEAPEALSTTYKLGAWYHSGRFDDRRFDSSGGLLASPSSSGIPRKLRGDFAVYGIVDQAVWRPQEGNGIGLFLRVQAGPSDRNLSDLSVDGGMNWKAPFPDRPDDVVGLSFAYLGISPAARQFSRDLVAAGRATSAYASNETVIEASYKAKVNERLTLQPDAQFVLNPNAHIPGPFGTKPLHNALVVGIRATVTLGDL